MLTSYFVLQKAVRDPSVASLSILAGEPDPAEWLQYNLEVDFPQQGEILSITLKDQGPAEDLVRLVDAVAKAYEEEVLYKAEQRRLGTSDLLGQSLRKLNEDMTQKWEDYIEMAQAAGQPQGDRRDAETDLLIGAISDLQKKASALQEKMYAMRTDYILMKGRIDDPMLVEQQIDAMLEQDVTMALYKNQMYSLQAQLAQMSQVARGGNNRHTSSINKQIAQVNAQMQQYRASMKQQYLNQQKNAPNSAKQMLNREFQTQFRALQEQYAIITKAMEDKQEELKGRLKTSVDLEKRDLELKQLQEIANDMNIKFESLEVEKSAPRQIVQIQPAVPKKGINTAQHYSISILGGLVGFGLTCLGIAYLEFRNRRLNGPDQVDEGLGIRVVGTLPSLSRRVLDPTHPVVAQLTESIDGVRTILMHDSTSKRRQVVLVTSAATMEGRTTVASQLAASLARAGRRTLIIDGDLRRPALHDLFDVPLEDGLCEVLRAEVDVADVIRPTHAEGLWLLTAGYCDIDAIHALATEQMQPVFDKLRTEYDFVIIDGAPVLGMSDALIFGQYSDGAILSVRRDHSQMPKIYQAAELLRGVGVRIIGSVVNGVPTRPDDRIVQMRLIAPKSERQLQPTG